MRISDFAAYAKEKYQVIEECCEEMPGVLTLYHPKTRKPLALLAQNAEGETLAETEYCELKCGSSALREQKPYLKPASKALGEEWTRIEFNDRTEESVVHKLLAKAILLGIQRDGCTIVLASQLPQNEAVYQDTPLPNAPQSASPQKPRESLPPQLCAFQKLQRERWLYSRNEKKNFYQQALFMQDYEDILPWEGEFEHYFPIYIDLNTRQLRGYFGWRTKVRHGQYDPVPESVAYIYLYELLNGVGAPTPEEIYEKLQEFEREYLDKGNGTATMRWNLRRWMREYAILYDLPPELAQQTLEEDTLQKDRAFAVLHDVQNYTDEQIFSALSEFAGKRTLASPLFTKCPERAAQLFGAAWRAASEYNEQGVNLFALCFGAQVKRRWVPFYNAQVYHLPVQKERTYALDKSRNYFCKGECWYESAYPQIFRNKAFFAGFLHEVERRLRRYLKVGGALKPNPDDAWATPYIDAALEADRKAQLEAAKPKISIDLAGLAKIRADAVLTRESLLTEEERGESEAPAPVLPPIAKDSPVPVPPAKAAPEQPGEKAPGAAPGKSENALLSPLECRVVQMLLEGQDPAALLKAEHQMPEVLADRINDALFDEIGDTVLECENDQLSILEDYQEDIKELLGRS